VSNSSIYWEDITITLNPWTLNPNHDNIFRQTKHSRQRERNNKFKKSLQWPWSLSTGTASIRRAQTHSSKLLLLVDLPLVPHPVVELLLVLLWCRKLGLDLAHGSCTCCCCSTDGDEDIVSQKAWQLRSLSLSLAPHSPRASIPTRPKCKFPLERPKSTQMQSLSNHQLCISWWDNSGWNDILRIRSLAVTLKLKLKAFFLTGEILPKKAILEIKNSKIKWFWSFSIAKNEGVRGKKN
jgi:hypothetical protein